MYIKRIKHNWHIKVICFVISMLLVFFTKMNTLKNESVIVFLETITNNNYTFTDPLPSRVTINLRGEESEIQKVKVDDIKAYIDASEIIEDGTYELPIIIRQDRVFNTTQDVEITVVPISITTKIEETITKYLRVESVITGIPAHGHELNSHFINPGDISVSGPKSYLKDLEIIKTDPIDVTGKNSDFTNRVVLDKTNSLLTFPEGDYVEFKGIVTETNVIKVIENVNIAIKELKDGFEIITELPRISVNVEGKLLSLQDFSRNNISLTVNLKDVSKPGTYELPITYWTPRYAHVYGKSKDTVTLEVVRVKP